MGDGGRWFEKTAVASGEHVLQGHKQHLLDAGEIGLPDPPPSAFGDNRAEDRGLRGGTEQDLAADRRAEAADPVRVDIRPPLKILGTCDQVAVAGPANEVAWLPPCPLGSRRSTPYP